MSPDAYQNMDVIAIDGPAASGKSTVGQLLAEALDYLFLDTGCMYRAVTLAVLEQRIDVKDETAVTRVAQEVDLEILPAHQAEDGRHYTALLSGRDVTWALRTPAIDANVSQVSMYLGVREEMVRQQRAYGAHGRVVMVGRDIGTVVMPQAPLKFYVTATAEERARRRWLDRQELGHSATYEQILADVKRRDRIDSSRQHSPLRPATDATVIDTTGRPVPEIVADILAQYGTIQRN